MAALEDKDYLAILKKYWGYDSFRSIQLDIIRSAGIDAGSEQQETEREIILTIRIPKRSAAAK